MHLRNEFKYRKSSYQYATKQEIEDFEKWMRETYEDPILTVQTYPDGEFDYICSHIRCLWRAYMFGRKVGRLDRRPDNRTVATKSTSVGFCERWRDYVENCGHEIRDVG